MGREDQSPGEERRYSKIKIWNLYFDYVITKYYSKYIIPQLHPVTIFSSKTLTKMMRNTIVLHYFI